MLTARIGGEPGLENGERDSTNDMKLTIEEESAKRAITSVSMTFATGVTKQRVTSA